MGGILTKPGVAIAPGTQKSRIVATYWNLFQDMKSREEAGKNMHCITQTHRKNYIL